MLWVFCASDLIAAWNTVTEVSIGFFIPIIFYSAQKKNVRATIKECFQRVKHEFDRNIPSQPQEKSGIDELEKLAILKERGFVTDEEFDRKKKDLLK
jgi:hypothetical protein